MVITLTDTRTGTVLGTITEEQLEKLSAQLEEEWSGDQDYYIDSATVDLLQGAGVSADVLDLLRRAITATGAADVRWNRA